MVSPSQGLSELASQGVELGPSDLSMLLAYAVIGLPAWGLAAQKELVFVRQRDLGSNPSQAASRLCRV